MGFYHFCCHAGQLSTYLQPALQSPDKRSPELYFPAHELSDAVLFPCNCKVKAPPETHHLPAQEDSLSASCCTRMLRRCFLYGIPHGTTTANQSCQWQKLSHNRKALITCVQVPWAWYSSHGIPCCPLLSTTSSSCHLQNMTATDTSGDEKLEGKDEGEEKQEPVEVTKKRVQNSRFLCTAGHRSVLYPRNCWQCHCKLRWARKVLLLATGFLVQEKTQNMEQPFSAKICLITEQSEHLSPCLPWQLPSPPEFSLPSPSHLCSTGLASITKVDPAVGDDMVPWGLQGWIVPHVTGTRAAAASCNSSKAWGSDAAPLPPLPWPGARALAPCLVAQQLLLAQGRKITLCTNRAASSVKSSLACRVQR